MYVERNYLKEKKLIMHERRVLIVGAKLLQGERYRCQDCLRKELRTSSKRKEAESRSRCRKVGKGVGQDEEPHSHRSYFSQQTSSSTESEGWIRRFWRFKGLM